MLRRSLLAAALVFAAPASIAAAAPLPETFLAASFLTDPLPADGSAGSVLRVDAIRVADMAPADDGAFVTLQVDPGSAAVCTIAGGTVAEAMVSDGHADFLITATPVSGICRVTATAEGAVSAEATLTTKDGGTPTRLTVSGNDSPRAVGDRVTLAVDIDDVYVNLVSDDRTTTVAATLDPATCSGAAAGPVTIASANDGVATDGRAWFIARSIGAYAACRVTFTAPGLRAAITTVAFEGGAPDHLACAFAPSAIGPWGIATASVELRDVFDNPVMSVRPYVISFARSTGDRTDLTSTDGRRMTIGVAFFFVLSGATAGRDAYVAAVGPGSASALPVPSTTCAIEVRTDLP